MKTAGGIDAAGTSMSKSLPTFRVSGYRLLSGSASSKPIRQPSCRVHPMLSYTVAALVFVLTLSGFWLGVRLSTLLPEHHLVSDARDSAKVGIGMLATLLALVLGLMITSAKRSFDEREAELIQLSTSIVLLDRALVGFGEETRPARDQLHGILNRIVELTERQRHKERRLEDAKYSADLRAITRLQQTILSMLPRNDSQKWYQSRAMHLSSDIAQSRVLTAEREDSSVPAALLVIVCGWVVAIYVGLGAFMVINRSVNVALAICALAFACSIFIILELDTPFSGVVGVSNKAVLRAQAELATN
ncbi:hypothetical protein QTI24_22290 [Variovorax sp. J22P240]|uniref:bestrophin-like domain n=1 Tax=Variovorax sp. J22P240 TaxID=3053514 RepID=UPI002577030F|nr:hypothetical protein [Variovorax sp. J22P240]MDM0001352.1 hypothetical protein [Variovorax sp. J22P240]